MNREKFVGHSWIVDVLSDIAEYAAKNNLRRLQVMVAETRIIAQDEIIARESQSNFEIVMAVPYQETENDPR